MDEFACLVEVADAECGELMDAESAAIEQVDDQAVARAGSVTHQRRRDDEADCRPKNAGLVEVRDGGAEDSR